MLGLTYCTSPHADMNVLRIEELPTKLPSQQAEGPALSTHSGVPPATTPPVSAPYMFSPTPSTLPQHAPGMSVQYIAIQPIQQSPTQAPLLPAAPGGVSYVVSDELQSLMWLEECSVFVQLRKALLGSKCPVCTCVIHSQIALTIRHGSEPLFFHG